MTRTADGPAEGAAREARVKIGPGDLIEVNVFDEPQLTQVVRLNDLGDGTLNLIGSLHLAGLTTDQARVLIAGKLREGNYLLSPQVSVLIREYSTQGVSVLGEVKNPGVYGVVGGQHLLDVLAAAGGTTPQAGGEITIQRSADGSSLTVPLSKDPHQSLSSNVQLYPGDKVIVPRAALVYVLGDVGRPGGFVMENDGRITLLQALAMAGGTTHTSSMNGSRLLRKGPAGYMDIHVELNKMLKGLEGDVQLQAGDILYIPGSAMKSAFARAVPAVLAATSGAAGAAVYRVTF
ncbi:MAG: polysaccharide export protein [Acidobacteriia bacterium]|nr:polysaccharide export protein [Terriglobia bacterium]